MFLVFFLGGFGGGWGGVGGEWTSDVAVRGGKLAIIFDRGIK